MTLAIDTASLGEAEAIAALQTRVADALTTVHGLGHWSSAVTVQSVARALQSSKVLVGRDDGEVVSTLRLVTKKPWAIDAKYFTRVRRPLYLLSMAVEPGRQRGGLGRRMLDAAAVVARDWPADAVRLDAYDHAAGAGPFYAKCGYRKVGGATYRGVPLSYFELLLT
ncbi:MAG: GNAT family N-acetyltransferase [Vicinamibacterales bacterium]